MGQELNSMIRSYAKNHEGCYEEAWNKIYRELNRRNHLYIKARAKHRNIRPLDMVEQMGLLSVLFVIALEIL